MVYILKCIACLLILLLVHRLFLQREAIHRFNRFFLLFSVVISFLIPLYTMEVPEIIEASPSIEDSSPIMAEGFTAEPLRQLQIDEAPIFHAVEETQLEFNWHYLVVSMYGLIAMIFLFRFVRNIKILVNQIQQNVKINYKGQTLVLLKGDSLPYSFLNYIFVTESDFENGKFSDAVFAHERTHIEEKHSWDNLFIELLMIPLWFHPGLYWAKAAIKLNHEFIADKVALQSTPLEKYENQLFSMMVDKQKFGLVSSLNFSLTKKRFEMMKRKSTGSASWIKVICLVPVLGVLVYIFSEKVTAKAEGVEQKAEVYVNGTEAITGEINFDLTLELKQNGVFVFEGKEYDLAGVKELLIEAKKALKDELKVNLITDTATSMGDLSDIQSQLAELNIRRIDYQSSEEESVPGIMQQDPIERQTPSQEKDKEEYYKNASFFVENEEGELVAKSYSELSDAEKSMLLLPPGVPEKKTPSAEQFDQWKNPDKYALWLDGKHIPNSQLDQMNNSDMVFYFDSYVHNNARSERFPQERQVNVYTPAGYDRSYGPDSEFGVPLTKEDRLYLYPSAKRVNFGKAWVKKGQDPVATYRKELSQFEVIKNEQNAFRKKTPQEIKQIYGMYVQLRDAYQEMTLEDQKNVRHASFPYAVIEKEGELIFKNREDLTTDEKNMIGC